jgi:hypothetical protein
MFSGLGITMQSWQSSPDDCERETALSFLIAQHTVQFWKRLAGVLNIPAARNIRGEGRIFIVSLIMASSSKLTLSWVQV